jgi:hypothetical protein
MGANLLTTASVIQCPHGGAAQLVTTNTTLDIDGAMALVETDVHPVVGCPFVLPGPKPSPCVTLTWTAGSKNVDADGVPVLTTASVGLCKSPEGAPQGLAVVASTQTDVSDD